MRLVQTFLGFRVLVANQGYFGRFVSVKITDNIRTPVTIANYTNADHTAPCGSSVPRRRWRSEGRLPGRGISDAATPPDYLKITACSQKLREDLMPAFLTETISARRHRRKPRTVFEREFSDPARSTSRGHISGQGEPYHQSGSGYALQPA